MHVIVGHHSNECVFSQCHHQAIGVSPDCLHSWNWRGCDGISGTKPGVREGGWGMVVVEGWRQGGCTLQKARVMG